MELSILQHAKDKAPRQIMQDAVVEQIRGEQWPAGYEPCLLIQGVYEGGSQQRSFYKKAFLFGNDYYKQLLDQECVRNMPQNCKAPDNFSCVRT